MHEKIITKLSNISSFLALFQYIMLFLINKSIILSKYLILKVFYISKSKHTK